MKGDNFHPFCLRTDCLVLGFYYKGHCNQNRYVLWVKKKITEMKIVYQKHLWKSFYQLHTSTPDLPCQLKSHVKVNVPELACRLVVPNPCGLSSVNTSKGSMIPSFSSVVTQFHFMASAQGVTEFQHNMGAFCTIYFFPGISEQGNKITWDHSLLNILGKNPIVISLYEARGLIKEHRTDPSTRDLL